MFSNYPQARAYAYVTSAVVGLVLGALQVWFAAVEQSQPVELTGALAVYAFVAGSLGLVAKSNTHEA